MTIYRVYWRYGSPYADKETDVDEAKGELQESESRGDISSAGVIDTVNGIAYVPTVYEEGDNEFSRDWDRHKEKLGGTAMETLELDITKYQFERYPLFPEGE